ncbi:hypothetical protein E2C01_037450 [Portunus trituberculatus]|uniref:Uncharacterized protein n=1 Tax=Portunus trituberculatus TaxID=210409 RepID=A0A5B7FE14_PORTR|nr:hypothetical protein [Portunus trituberculatus]
MRFNQSSPATKHTLLDSILLTLPSTTSLPINCTTSAAMNHQPHSTSIPSITVTLPLITPSTNKTLSTTLAKLYSLTQSLPRQPSIIPSVSLPLIHHPPQPVDATHHRNASTSKPSIYPSLLVASIYQYNAIHTRHHDLYPGLASTPHCSRQKLARRDLPPTIRQGK